MRQLLAGLLALTCVLMAGCSGGGEGDFRGEVSGIVFDEDGTPVRNANVYYDSRDGDRNVRTNSNGVFVLGDLPTGDQVIRVEAFGPSGVRFFGSNVARINRGERTLNTNITVFRDDRIGSLEGFVFNREGNALEGVRVFARIEAGGMYSSAFGITDSEGKYKLGGLRSGVTYQVQVNAFDYDGDWTTFVLNPGQIRRMDFTVDFADDVLFSPPTLNGISSWTSPAPTRDSRQAEAMLVMKRLLKPGYKGKPADSRTTAGGGLVEVDLFWQGSSDNAILGYGVYRAQGSGGSFRDIAFYRDPYGDFFADTDVELRDRVFYRYALTTVSTYGNESNLSNERGVMPLGSLITRNATGGNRPTFRWDAAAGAQQYAVYLFDRYPSIGVSPYWTSDAVTGTSTTLTGSSLPNGTYYYLVAGWDADGNNTIGEVVRHDVP